MGHTIAPEVQTSGTTLRPVGDSVITQVCSEADIGVCE